MTFRAATCALLIAASPAPALAQCSGLDIEPCPIDAPRWVGELAVLGANAMLSALTAGVVRWARGGGFADGFAPGALGGAVVYGGKRIAAERFDGAGLIGREVAAVGSSIARNAADGIGPLDRLILPIGPARLDVRTRDGMRVRARLDALAFAWTVYGVVERELTLDWRESLSAGTPVFRTDGKIFRIGGDTADAAGTTLSGVIYLADVPAFGEAFRARMLAHERVHVLQGDHLFTLWTDPLEDAFLDAVPAARGVGSVVDLGLSTEVLRLFVVLFPEHDERPWELESIFLAR